MSNHRGYNTMPAPTTTTDTPSPSPPPSSSSTDVLIVGAGPTGLVLALWLSKQGVRVRIIDKAVEAATSTRALAVQARTMELYAQYHPDLAHAVVANGHTVSGFNAWVNGRRAFRAAITQIGEGTTPFPYVKMLSQHEHERMLMDRLHRDFGISVELQTELVGFHDDSDAQRVVACLRRGGSDSHGTSTSSEETIEAKFIAGCDGSHSAVRKALGISFPGGTYEQVFYVADVQASGPTMDGELHICLDQADFLAVFPLADHSHARLTGTVRRPVISPETETGPEPEPDQAEADNNNNNNNNNPDEQRLEQVTGRAVEQMKLHVDKVNWFSTYRVHHRVAHSFRKGRAFLLGDAAHVHSPAGGQGMNTGIGDAVNLAWKMAAVLHGRAHDALLDTYAEERARFAGRLVATTDRAFTLATSTGWLAGFVRTKILPLLAPLLLSFRAVRRYVFSNVSQIALNYGGMTLSGGGRGRVSGGQRLPWVQLDEGETNHDSLSMEWQVHTYGTRSEGLASWCKARGVGFVVFKWATGCAAAGLVRDAVYVVRPDGYVALVQSEVDIAALEAYFADRQIYLSMG